MFRSLQTEQILAKDEHVGCTTFAQPKVGPAADKPRRPTISRASIGGPALALLAGPTLRLPDSHSPGQMLHSVALRRACDTTNLSWNRGWSQLPPASAEFSRGGVPGGGCCPGLRGGCCPGWSAAGVTFIRSLRRS